ncbi:glycoside hydrolase family 43 protein [Bacteroides sp. UBA939]|uniref:glycoside hydrolase family 43 protein n=1 Tax=Bacteroides sp. UBA939 TaxID=1946092 RepID=UPI0025BCBFD1|nr:glycoside hydrolase family 43 protein [Bacteroides sp. UBA939]
MKKPFHLIITLSALCLLACNQTRNTESAKQYTYIGWQGKHKVDTVCFDSLQMSDPFILADEATETYYMVGSGGSMWKSPDMKMWTGPHLYLTVDTTSWIGTSPRIWAPELHEYRGKYYCFVTFTNPRIIVDTVPNRYHVQRRSTHILVSDKAEGPYQPVGDGNYLPEDWSVLDGSLWEEDGVPYMVFCHEWMQTVNGMVDYVRLTPDLSGITGNPAVLFRASEATWSREMQSIGELTFGMALEGYVADGPFVFRTGTGRLGMLWSSWGSRRCAQGVAYSESGKLAGPWTQCSEPLVANNAGHGMLFRTFEGKLLMCLHRQSLDMENPGPRRPVLLEVDTSGERIKILGEYYP